MSRLYNKGPALLLVALLAPALATAAGPHWSYEDQAGPEHWGELDPGYAACASGQQQSPINIANDKPAKLPKLEFSYTAAPLKIRNNGHTIQVDYAPGSTLTLDGQTYQLAQFHFHTPSEHLVDGRASPMEMHLVHKNERGELAVVGVMLTEGAANALLQAIWNKMPAQEGEVTVAGATIDAGALLPKSRAYATYSGSLTTPPCSEGVRWIVLKQPITLSEAQIDAFRAVFPMNARPVQPLGARSIEDRIE